jgi:putative ABC transport system permease protein
MPFLYLPFSETAPAVTTLFVVTDENPAAFGSTLRSQFKGSQTESPVSDIRTMSQHVRYGALAFERLTAQVLSAVGVIGLVLSVIGLYGIVAYSVSRRTHEMGIRIAVGATTGAVLRLVLAEGLKLGVLGTVLGIVISTLLSAILGVFLSSSNSADSATGSLVVYASVIVLSLAVTSLACYLPARRASLVDPNVALRCD